MFTNTNISVFWLCDIASIWAFVSFFASFHCILTMLFNNNNNSFRKLYRTATLDFVCQLFLKFGYFVLASWMSNDVHTSFSWEWIIYIEHTCTLYNAHICRTFMMIIHKSAFECFFFFLSSHQSCNLMPTFNERPLTFNVQSLFPQMHADSYEYQLNRPKYLHNIVH